MTTARFDEYSEFVELLTSIQDALDNAVISYRVSEDAVQDQTTVEVEDGVVLVHPNNRNALFSAYPSFHWEHVD